MAAAIPLMKRRDSLALVARPGAIVRRIGTVVAGLMLAWGSAASGADETKATPPAPPPNSDAACLECHSDTDLTMKKDGRKLSLFVDPKIGAKSAHRSLNCVDCHENYDGDASPHRKPLTSVDCAGCHEKLGKTHAFHPRLARPEIPKGDDTTCVACHGKHDTAEVKKPAFAFFDGPQAQACGKCHEQARDHFLVSAHGKAFREKQPNAPDCLTCHRDRVVPAGRETSLALKLAQAKQCESCHVEKQSVAGKALRGTRFVAAFEDSVHGAALRGGKAEAANCVDCHGAHEMNRALTADARLNKQHVAGTCSSCHKKAAIAFDESVHAEALRKGNADSATCTNCHGEHEILAKKNPASPVHATNVAQQVCADCHASLKLTKKYGIASHAFETFSDSYHGLAVRGGAVEVVNCASCHSSHAIKSETDPASTIHRDNLAKTCGECHPGANTRFALGKVHVSPEAGTGKGGSNPILHLVSSVYVFLIVAVIGGMAVHNGLDLVKKIRRKLAIQKGLIEEGHVAHRLYLRMSVNERVQHAVLVVSFTLLVVTGFMLRYPEAWWVVALRNLNARAFEWRGLIHRVAGVVMLGAGAWHVLYLACTVRGRELFRDIRPRMRDLKDPWLVLKYNVGLAATKPQFGRFSYIEKAEYWAMMWGTILMGITGAILWFDNSSMAFLSKLGFDISRTIHFYEAILATLAIIVWHFYFVVFNPDIYPMNLAWLTGRMSEKEMLEEHPAQLAELKKLAAVNDTTKQAPPPA